MASLSSSFNNFVSSLTPKKTANSSSPFSKPLYPTPTGNSPKVTGVFTPTIQPKPTVTPVTSNAGATNPVKPKMTYTPFVPDPNLTKSQLPPAGQQFAQSLNTPQASPTNSANPTAPTSTPTVPTANTESPYLKYLNSLFDPEQLKTAYNKSTEANERLAGIQNESEQAEYTARREKEQLLDRTGTGVGANARAANESIRRNSPALADFALRENAAARTAGVYKDVYDQMIGAGKTVFEAETAAAKAEQDQKNKDREFIQTDENIKADNKLEQDKFDENKRQFGLEYALEQQKANAPKPLSAAQEAKELERQEKEIAAQQSASQSIGLVNNLLNNNRYKAISGGLQTGSVPFLGDRAAVNEYDQLQGLLKLGIRGLLKGQGAVSDYEGKVLGQAASALSRLTNEDQMKDALQKVRGVLKTNNGQVTPVEVTNPETGEKVNAELSGPEIYQLTNDGNIITYK